MKVNYIKDGFNYPNNIHILLSPRPENNKRAFEQILYPEKKQAPFSKQILNRTRIISELKNSIERVYIKNEDYFTKLKELNANYNSHSFDKYSYLKKRTLFKKKTIKPPSLYNQIQKRNSYYLEKSKNKRISKSRNYNNPLLKQKFAKTQIDLFNKKNNLSSYRDDNKDLFNKFKQTLNNKNRNKYLISRNRILIPTNLTDINTKSNTSRRDIRMKKAVSSGTLSEKNISFYKNQNSESDKYCLKSINPINRFISDKNNLKFLKPYPSNITFTNCIRDYTDKKHENNNFSTPNNSNDLFLNLNKDTNNNLSSSKINTYNNYNYIFSEEAKSPNQNFSTSIIRINKLNLLNKDNAKNSDGLKKVANNFKNFFNNKIKILKSMTHNSNKVLIELIDKNNQEINISKGKELKMSETLEEELDIRKDILSDKTKKQLKESKTYKIIQEKDYQVKSYNLLKKNLNIISDSDAMKMLEKCLDKSQKEKLDINKLLKERINKKLEKECMNIGEIRKKTEKNYKKIIKMRYNL